MKPKYDYSLNIDGKEYPLKVKIGMVGSRFALKCENFDEFVFAESEEKIYEVFERKTHYTLLNAHVDGTLYQYLPGYPPENKVEVAQLLARPRKTFFGKMKYFISSLVKTGKLGV